MRRVRNAFFVITSALLIKIVIAIFSVAWAGYGTFGTNAPSHVNPVVVKIDENKYLGVSVNQEFVLQDLNGVEFKFADRIGKPLVLVFSYFGCDGSCPTVNKILNKTLNQVDKWQLGKDFRVLTVSFDRLDTLETLSDFVEHAGFNGNLLPEGWTMATLKNPEDIRVLTKSVGFKFFWEPRDRVFLHPNVYMVLSPKGRITRFLYPNSINASDLEVAITKAFGDEITLNVNTTKKIINLIISACYSYNYKDGKYKLNYPLFIAFGALVIGIAAVVWGSLIMRRRIRLW